MHNENEFWQAFAPCIARGGCGWRIEDVVRLSLVSRSANAGVKAALALVTGGDEPTVRVDNTVGGEIAAYDDVCNLSAACQVFYNDYRDPDGQLPEEYFEEHAETLWRSYVGGNAAEGDPPQWRGRAAVAFTPALCINPIAHLTDINATAVRMITHNRDVVRKSKEYRRVLHGESALNYVVEHCPRLTKLVVSDLTQRYFFKNMSTIANELPCVSSLTFALCTELTDERLAEAMAAFPLCTELCIKSCHNITAKGLAPFIRDNRLTMLSALGFCDELPLDPRSLFDEDAFYDDREEVCDMVFAEVDKLKKEDPKPGDYPTPTCRMGNRDPRWTVFYVTKNSCPWRWCSINCTDPYCPMNALQHIDSCLASKGNYGVSWAPIHSREELWLQFGYDAWERDENGKRIKEGVHIKPPPGWKPTRELMKQCGWDEQAMKEYEEAAEEGAEEGAEEEQTTGE
jgi:hypothetical protein